MEFFLVYVKPGAQPWTCKSIVHATLLLLGLWLFAFVSLCLALLLLNIYSDLIGYDFALYGLRKELILAAICSLIEAVSVWAVKTYVPGAARALLAPPSGGWADLHGDSSRGLEPL